MTRVTTIAYVHSKICESIIETLHNSGRMSVSGIVYGRGFRGFSNKNPMYLFDDQLSTETEFVTYAYLISKYYSLFSDQSIRLIIPHDRVFLTRLLASHCKISEVYYLEEGDLSYDTTQNLYTSHNQPFAQAFNGPMMDHLTQLGFRANQIGSTDNPPSWFSDSAGQYRGVIASSHLAFTQFPGNRINVDLSFLKLFNDRVGLITLTLLDGPIRHLKSLLHAHGLALDSETILTATTVVFKEYLNVAIQHLRDECNEIIVKRHPSLSPFIFKSLIEDVNGVCINWDDTELEFQTRNYELGYINFHQIFSIGNSSTVRYARSQRSDHANIIMVTNNQLAAEVIHILKNAMEQVNTNGYADRPT